MFHVTGKGDDPIIIHMNTYDSYDFYDFYDTPGKKDHPWYKTWLVNWYWHAIAIKSDSYP